MTKAREELLRHVVGGAGAPEAGTALDGLEQELRGWCEGRARFEAFLDAHRDKVRKKVRTAGDGEALADVRAELLVAYRLLGERRFEVAFEAYGSGNRGPDLTATWRGNVKVNVEVTRLRVGSDDVDPARLGGVLLGKLRQLPAGAMNVVALVTASDVRVGVEEVAPAVRLLKGHAERREEVVFTRRGYAGVRDFFGAFLRLSGVMVVGESPVAENAERTADEGALWLNPEARHPLPREMAIALGRRVG